jgi:hypothetical protein
MDENQYCDSKFIAPDKRAFKGLEYSLVCRRTVKSAAEAIKKDMEERGKNCIITAEGGEFYVWWN